MSTTVSLSYAPNKVRWYLVARGGREESAGRVVAFLPNFCSPRRGEIGGRWEVLLLFGIFGFLGVKGQVGREKENEER